jgi:hypothetical protein
MVEEQATEQTEQTAPETTSDVSRGAELNTETNIPIQPRPEHIPEKFYNTETGEVMVDEMGKSYTHLEKFSTGKKDEMKESLIAELQTEAREGLPEKAEEYTLPKLVDGITEEIVEANPLTGWWRGKCHEIGLPQEEFESGVNQYVDFMLKSLPNQEEEIGKLGENAKERIEAVNNWYFKILPPEKFEIIQATLGATAQGIEVLETMMENQRSTISHASDVSQPEKEFTMADVKEMMKDKRYFDPRHRDSGYIKKVDEAWSRLQLAGKI